MTSALKTAGCNLAVLLAGAIPLAIITAWIEGLIHPVEWKRDVIQVTEVSEVLSAFLFWYLVLIVPVLIGGILHQVLLRFLPMPHGATGQRIALLLSTPIVLLGFLVVGNSPGGMLVGRAIAPIIIALLGYGMLVRGLSTNVPTSD